MALATDTLPPALNDLIDQCCRETLRASPFGNRNPALREYRPDLVGK